VDALPTACVVYAAKSTEDRRGSIPDQIRECRHAIEDGVGRAVVGQYVDEAFSAYTGSRGPGLTQAFEHAEELATEGRDVELWAQHSDRLARGDGRTARHAVEIALWALKRDVRVRTVQDPDTFRDLLYAVVTGQRNHEDSRRKGLAIASGMSRMAARGEHIGAYADGYRRVIEVDDAGQLRKHTDIDPDRQAVIEMIFRLALRGKRTGAIARSLNDAGWKTKPMRRSAQPRSWTCYSVLSVLRNPRYAGLATYKGEIIGPGSWPAYITERQYHRIRARLWEGRPTRQFRAPEKYLLARIAHCGYCGGPMHVHTGHEREDGTFARRYVCASHAHAREERRCPAPRIDADVAEAMFVSALRVLWATAPVQAVEVRRHSQDTSPPWRRESERKELMAALLSEDDQALARSLESMLAEISPDVRMLRRMAASSREARQAEVAERLVKWVQTIAQPRTTETRAETARLNSLLRSWFVKVTIAIDDGFVTIVGFHRAMIAQAETKTQVRFARDEWRRFSPTAERTNRTYTSWPDAEIIGALQRWADKHGRAPRSCEWVCASPEHPNSPTVRRRFTSWSRALSLAGLKPANPRAVKRWSDEEILRALRRWSERRGQPPMRHEWIRGTPWRPCKTTVYNRFGSWPNALAAAGLTP
jgi:Homing endonuclease associated repeat/Recombinase/Resolvase, N terminal domain/Recombinase zinc beta ribbon domain